MPAYRVLIVDDQRDVRRVLHDGIQTLNLDIDVTDVPSGEEAILVTSRQPIDLMVTDVRLPGISGLELLERARIRNPNMKFILVTGLQDQEVKDNVVRAGAHAYFFKPVDMLGFLDAVSKCLDLGVASLAGAEAQVEEEAGEEFEEEDLEENDTQIQPQTLSAHLSGLRQELQADCVMLMGERGEVMAQAGALPEAAEDETFISSLLATFGAAAKVSYILDMQLPRDLLYFAGQGKSFILTHVGQSLGLLVVVEGSRWDNERIWTSLRSIPTTVQNLFGALTKIGVFNAGDEGVDAKRAPETEVQFTDEQILPELDAIFKQARRKKIKPEDADAFWESVSLDGAGEVTRADIITYDQARQLGLAPEDE
ncbi:MAG: response regulator [Anaerolineales bacterium]|nr:response regulator [Anaerolineales bacterium]